MSSTRTLPDAIAGPLRRLTTRYAESPIPGFLSWWGESLRSCLPAKWREAMAAEAAQLWLQRDGDSLRLRRSDAPDDAAPVVLALGSDQDVGSAFIGATSDAQRALPRVLLLEDSRVLRRRLTLPAATADNLRAVVGYELDRQTPFKPDQVYYDCRIARRDAASKQIEVDLILTPRAALDAELTALDGIAEGLDAVDIVGEDGQPTGCNLLPAERRARRGHGVVLIALGLAALTVVLLAMAGAQSLDNRRDALARLQEEVDARRVEARRVNQLRERLTDAVEGANFLAVRRSETPPVLDLVNELTYRMPPETTYLERLSLSGDKLSISGQSNQAAELVGLLQPSPQIRSVSLSGSIQPDSRTGKDRFTIAAQYVMPDGGIQRDYSAFATKPEADVKVDSAGDAKEDAGTEERR